MLRKCGPECFLGPDKSFPVCPVTRKSRKPVCKVVNKGLAAAYIRARQWGKKKSDYKGKTRPSKHRSVYEKVARKSRRALRKRGKKIGKSSKRR